MNLNFTKLKEPSEEIAATFTRWENDPALIPFMRLNKNQDALEKRKTITIESLNERLKDHQIFLIHLDGQLVGEVNFMVDPAILYKKESGTAWIGIDIGEEAARGRGVGSAAMLYVEQQIQLDGHKRIELGVFEFNHNAIRLYQKSGYTEIGRLDDFTYWQGKMWQDVRMEKYLKIHKMDNRHA